MCLLKMWCSTWAQLQVFLSTLLSFLRLVQTIWHASVLKCAHTHAHTICYHNDVETGGRRGQGVAIILHNGLAGLNQMWKFCTLYQATWIYINGSVVFGVQGRVLWGAVNINPRSSTHLMLILPWFSHVQHDVFEAWSESQHTMNDSGGGF